MQYKHTLHIYEQVPKEHLAIRKDYIATQSVISQIRKADLSHANFEKICIYACFLNHMCVNTN